MKKHAKRIMVMLMVIGILFAFWGWFIWWPPKVLSIGMTHKQIEDRLNTKVELETLGRGITRHEQKVQRQVPKFSCELWRLGAVLYFNNEKELIYIDYRFRDDVGFKR